MAHEDIELILKQENNLLKRQVNSLESKVDEKNNSLSISELRTENAVLKQRLIEIEKNIRELTSNSKKSDDDVQSLQIGLADAKATTLALQNSQTIFQSSYTDIYGSSLTWYSVIITLVLGIAAYSGYLFINKIRRQEVKDVCEDVKAVLKTDLEISSLVVHALSHQSVTDKFSVMKAEVIQDLQQDIKNEINDKLANFKNVGESSQLGGRRNTSSDDSVNEEVRAQGSLMTELESVIDTGEQQ